ncbi:hypothetical protein [Streptomyces halstedii]|uniref:hypothetical protein n=1 Tax=Streptomyces halstedii TaxID=1944 RepID=UPI00382E1F16
MPYAHTACQLEHAQTPDSPEKSSTEQGTPCPSVATWTPVVADDMDIDTTASRHTGPRNWLRSVEWLINAGLHPKANQTTLAVAQDLARRMDYSTGHVRYGLEDMANRLGIDRSSVARHVKYLRQLGALAWAQRGTRRNVRRLLGLPGYAATATVYAAVIPAAYDHALGHRIVGEGYGARVVVDHRGTQAAGVSNSLKSAVDNSSSGPVDNSAKRSCATPSLTPATYGVQVQMVGGVTTTATRPNKTSDSPSMTGTAQAGSNKKRATILGNTVTAAGMHLGDKLAAAIRRAVPWTRRATHDQLRWVCADMGEQQWSVDQAVRFAVETGHQHAAGYAWQPARPHRLIAAALRTADTAVLEDQAPADMEFDLAHSVTWEDSTAGKEAARLAGLAALFAPLTETEPERTDEDRLRARADWNAWPQVAQHYADDPDDALDLYGERLCTYAVRQDSKSRDRQEAWA